MGKSYIDRSDQMASYSSPLKRSLKWYRKIAFDILLSTSVVNALSLFKSVTKNNVKITFFKEEIIKSLLHKPEIPKTIPLKANHNLVTSENGKKRMCQKCYATISTTLGRKAAQNKTRKVLTRCDECNIYIYVETVLLHITKIVCNILLVFSVYQLNIKYIYKSKSKIMYVVHTKNKEKKLLLLLGIQ